MTGVAILGYARTPIGAFRGELAALAAPRLGAAAIAAAVRRAGVATVDEVVMGCVLAAGQGQAPARQAGRGAGLPDRCGATTVNKMCGSGMKALMMGADAIRAGSARLVVAGGMESMSNAPYLARRGLSFGHAALVDHLLADGLEDADEHRAMGCYAEDLAGTLGLSREAQDAFARESLARAQRAWREGWFDAEVVAVGDVRSDEVPRRAKPERIAALKPAFREGGTVTAASSSSLADGAAALVLAPLAAVARPCFHLVAQAGFAQEPAGFTTAPAGAMRAVLERAGWSADSVDLWEVNEAFAVVAMAARQEIGIPPERLNVHGGACALGHPIGASGARIVVTLLAALEKYAMKRGVASLCIGGGEATAVAFERIE